MMAESTDLKDKNINDHRNIEYKHANSGFISTPVDGRIPLVARTYANIYLYVVMYKLIFVWF